MCMVNADIITSVLQIWVGVFGVGIEFCLQSRFGFSGADRMVCLQCIVLEFSLQSLRPAYSLVLEVEVHSDCELASDFIVCKILVHTSWGSAINTSSALTISVLKFACGI
jgi:hypothetical protein